MEDRYGISDLMVRITPDAIFKILDSRLPLSAFRIIVSRSEPDWKFTSCPIPGSIFTKVITAAVLKGSKNNKA